MNLKPIRAVLDRAAEIGPPIQVWWRDDDAVAASPALDSLLALSRSVGAPVGIAAIPAKLEPSLPARLRDEPGARILVHGFRHANHAAAGRKSAEFGSDRCFELLSTDAAAGLTRVRELAGDVSLPVFVPPWNRISRELASALAPLGYGGLSTFGPRHLVPGLKVVNTHLDPVDWRGTRSAIDPARLAAALEQALAASDDPGPIGLLTHHLMFDESLWRLTVALVEVLAGHPAVSFPELDVVWSAEERH